MGEINESMGLLVQLCLNCNHPGRSHMKANALSNKQGRLRGPLIGKIFTKCNECKKEGKEKICQQFKPKQN